MSFRCFQSSKRSGYREEPRPSIHYCKCRIVVVLYLLTQPQVFVPVSSVVWLSSSLLSFSDYPVCTNYLVFVAVISFVWDLTGFVLGLFLAGWTGGVCEWSISWEFVLSFCIDVPTLYSSCMLECMLDQSGNLLLVLAMSVSLNEATVVAISDASMIYDGKGLHGWGVPPSVNCTTHNFIVQMLSYVTFIHF